jgi:hypothetical protein
VPRSKAWLKGLGRDPPPTGHSQFGRAMAGPREVILIAACLALIAFFSWEILREPEEFAPHSEGVAGVLTGAAVAPGQLP